MSDILVVDDELPIQDLLTMLCGREKIPYRIAVNGHRALALARESWPAAVLLDMGLPEPLDGWTTWARLEELAAGRPLRVILFTSMDMSPAEETEFAARGGRAVIGKPPDTRQLVQWLRDLLAEAPVE